MHWLEAALVLCGTLLSYYAQAASEGLGPRLGTLGVSRKRKLE